MDCIFLIKYDLDFFTLTLKLKYFNIFKYDVRNEKAMR